jgi:hypothetical protein
VRLGGLAIDRGRGRLEGGLRQGFSGSGGIGHARNLGPEAGAAKYRVSRFWKTGSYVSTLLNVALHASQR